jgi:hypothetical protein
LFLPLPLHLPLSQDRTPHGHPIALRYSHNDIAKAFQRI